MTSPIIVRHANGPMFNHFSPSSPVVPADDLELREEGGDSRVVAGRDLRPDTTWGPYPGILQSEGRTADQKSEVGALMCSPSCNHQMKLYQGVEGVNYLMLSNFFTLQ